MRAIFLNNMIVSMSMDDELLARFDDALKTKGYSTRSEAMRDLVRTFISDCDWEGEEGDSIAVITLLYGKEVKKPELMRIQHRYREISTMLHTHIDPINCLEVYVIKASSDRIKELLKEFRGLQGVKVVKFVKSACEV